MIRNFTITVKDNRTGETSEVTATGYYLGFYEEEEEGLVFDDMYEELTEEDLDFIIDEAIKTMHKDFPDEPETPLN